MKLYVTVGLPRSGKTTWAKTTGWPIVNPDSIRLSLHGQRFYGPAEPFVWAMAYAMVEALRLAGHERIVVDATNVSAKRRKEWEDRYPGAVEWKLIDTSAEECIRRARALNDEAIVPVIERMAKEWDFRYRVDPTPTREDVIREDVRLRALVGAASRDPSPSQTASEAPVATVPQAAESSEANPAANPRTAGNEGEG